MKRIIALIMCMIMLFCSSKVDCMAAENTVPNEKKQYEVYNGYGKFIYEAESLEEAETYIESITEGANRAAKSGTLVFWTGISIALNVITLIGFTAYSINQYYLGEQEAIEIIDHTIPLAQIQEIVQNKQRVGYYAVSLTVKNPYPPNSYRKRLIIWRSI